MKTENHMLPDLNTHYKKAYAKEITIQYVMNYYRQHCLMLYELNLVEVISMLLCKNYINNVK